MILWHRGILPAVDLLSKHALVGVSSKLQTFTINWIISLDHCDYENYCWHVILLDHYNLDKLLSGFMVVPFFFFFLFFKKDWDHLHFLYCRYSTLLDLDCSALNHCSVSGLFRFSSLISSSSASISSTSTASWFLLTLFVLNPNMQQVYMYFRGSGKAQEIKRDAARGTVMQAF